MLHHEPAHAKLQLPLTNSMNGSSPELILLLGVVCAGADATDGLLGLSHVRLVSGAVLLGHGRGVVVHLQVQR